MQKLQAPTADEIFKMWVESLDKKTLEKFFKQKNVPLDKSRIPAGENIKKVEKKVMALIHMKIKLKYKEEEKIVTVSKLVKIDFYNYENPEPVPVFKSIERITCKFCNGSGRVECDACDGKGTRVCPKCEGKGYIRCKDCNGTGKIKVTINVRLSETKVTVKAIEVNCPTCAGTGKLICPECHGLGKIVCEHCGGSGYFKCKHCEGYGYNFKFKIAPIGKAERNIKLLIPKKTFEEKIRKAVLAVINEIEGIAINSETYLEEDKLVQILGFKDDSIPLLVKEFKKLKNELKKKSGKIVYPIILYPVVTVYVESIKGKKAQLIGVGTINKYKVFRVK